MIKLSIFLIPFLVPECFVGVVIRFFGYITSVLSSIPRGQPRLTLILCFIHSVSKDGLYVWFCYAKKYLDGIKDNNLMIQARINYI